MAESTFLHRGWDLRDLEGDRGVRGRLLLSGLRARALLASAPHGLRGPHGWGPAHPGELQLYRKPLQATRGPEARVLTSVLPIT